MPANSTWDDFFTARLYKGDIYKTTNLQNRTLSQYCPTDSAMVKEQKRIEKELVDFEKTLYGRDLIEETDSVSTTSGIKTAKTNSKKRGRENAVTTKSKSSSSSKSKSSAGKSQSVSKREAAAPKASVRRQRR